jgi:hypothetical protein
MPAFRKNSVCQRKAAADGYSVTYSSTWYYLQNLKCCRGEFRIWLWYRDVFTAQLGEAVIGTDEEIEATNMVLLIVRRTV